MAPILNHLNLGTCCSILVCIATLSEFDSTSRPTATPTFSAQRSGENYFQLRENSRKGTLEGGVAGIGSVTLTTRCNMTLKFLNIPQSFSQNDKYFDVTNNFYFTVGNCQLQLESNF